MIHTPWSITDKFRIYFEGDVLVLEDEISGLGLWSAEGLSEYTKSQGIDFGGYLWFSLDSCVLLAYELPELRVIIESHYGKYDDIDHVLESRYGDYGI